MPQPHYMQYDIVHTEPVNKKLGFEIVFQMKYFQLNIQSNSTCWNNSNFVLFVAFLQFTLLMSVTLTNFFLYDSIGFFCSYFLHFLRFVSSDSKYYKFDTWCRLRLLCISFFLNFRLLRSYWNQSKRRRTVYIAHVSESHYYLFFLLFTFNIFLRMVWIYLYLYFYGTSMRLRNIKLHDSIKFSRIIRFPYNSLHRVMKFGNSLFLSWTLFLIFKT